MKKDKTNNGEKRNAVSSVPVTIYLPIDTLNSIKKSRRCLSYGFIELMSLLIIIGMEEMGIEHLKDLEGETGLEDHSLFLKGPEE